jgi:hypothetical protein
MAEPSDAAGPRDSSGLDVDTRLPELRPRAEVGTPESRLRVEMLRTFRRIRASQDERTPANGSLDAGDRRRSRSPIRFSHAPAAAAGHVVGFVRHMHEMDYYDSRSALLWIYDELFRRSAGRTDLDPDLRRFQRSIAGLPQEVLEWVGLCAVLNMPPLPASRGNRSRRP